MKTIVCYGDSNTWGTPPGGVGRYPWTKRWTGILQGMLADRARVIEEGLPGRTTAIEDPFSSDRSGIRFLPVVLESHCPIDLLIVMLGTNDMKAAFNRDANTIAAGVAELLDVSLRFKPAPAHVLVVSPPRLVQTPDRALTEQFTGGLEKSQALAECFKRVAAEKMCHFFDAASVAESSPIDGIHFDEKAHHALARGMAATIERILESRL